MLVGPLVRRGPRSHGLCALRSHRYRRICRSISGRGRRDGVDRGARAGSCYFIAHRQGSRPRAAWDRSSARGHCPLCRCRGGKRAFRSFWRWRERQGKLRSGRHCRLTEALAKARKAKASAVVAYLCCLSRDVALISPLSSLCSYLPQSNTNARTASAGMNSTPAPSRARRMATRFSNNGTRRPFSKSRTVELPTPAFFAS
jgi:hypothetical protein